ncbi:MAG: DNA polymerase III subunit beta [Patescibacteria group bacterium]|nr:DNA polymerase III subunit beta [Patescibacteria group bacterium]
MRLECVKDKIKDAVSKIEKIVGQNHTLPILNTILLIINKNTITLRATNLDIGIEIEIPAKIESQGNIAVPGKVFSNLLASIYEGNNIILEEKNGNLEVLVNNNKTLIKCLPPDEFPTLPLIQEGDSFFIEADKLNEGIKSVIYSASISDIKPELSSVYIHTENSNIVFVATDSFRLAEKKIKNENKKELKGIIIPFKNALELSRIFEGESGVIDIRFNKNQIVFSLDHIYFTSRIIDGVFPDYKQIIPKEYKTEIILLKQDFLNSLKVSNIFSDKFNQVIMFISPQKKAFTIKTKNTDVGESNIQLNGTLKGEELEISFNYKYIIDCFQALHQDSVVIKCNGFDKPMTIQGVGDNSFTYLVMPMNK